MSETELVQGILLALGSRPDLRVWRQNTGVAWQPITSAGRAALGRLVKGMSGHFRPVKYGSPGSADIHGVGLVDRTGRPLGRFLAVEAKTEDGRQSEEQRNWEAMVVRHGGLYVLAHSVDAAVRGVEEAINGTR